MLFENIFNITRNLLLWEWQIGNWWLRMPKSAKFRVWSDLKIIHAVSLIALFVTLNVVASIAALFVGNELHKGDLLKQLKILV